MTFKPRISEARTLAAAGVVTAMIDLSDGLSRDLPRLCEQSGVGAIVIESDIPVHEDAVEMRRDGRSPIEHALHDGEDYELLYTAHPTRAQDLIGTQIGVIVDRSMVMLWRDGVSRPLVPMAWEHTL